MKRIILLSLFITAFISLQAQDYTIEYAVIDCKDKFTACYTNCPYCGHRVFLGAPSDIDLKIYRGTNFKFCGNCDKKFYYEDGDFKAYVKTLQQKGLYIGSSGTEVVTDMMDKTLEMIKQNQENQQKLREQQLELLRQQQENQYNWYNPKK